MITRNRISAVLSILLLVMVPFVSAQDETSDDDTPLEAGEVFLLQGRVLDTAGDPIIGAVVEIWQTDVDGDYDHPNDTDSADLDPNFQYFGTSAVDDDGYYAFRTIRPLEYGNRPAHIHVKVRLDEAEILITQFYFEEYSDSLGAFAEFLVLLPEAMTDDTNDTNDTHETVIVATRDLVIDMGTGDTTLEATPAQQEGPFYPVVDVSEFDNDLTSTADDDDLVTAFLPDMDTTGTTADNIRSGRALYRIVSEDSVVNFILQEDLRGQRIDVVGTTDQVAGDLIVDFDAPMFSQVGVMRINARTLQTDNQFRDRALRAEILLSAQDEFEFIEFAPTAINNVPEGIMIGEPYTFEVIGNLTIINTTNEVTFTVEAILEDDSRLVGSASTIIFYADWGITIPSVPGVANISEDVTLTINFSAEEVIE